MNKRYRKSTDTVDLSKPRNRAVKCCIKFRAQWGTGKFETIWLHVLYATINDLLKKPEHEDRIDAEAWLAGDLDELQLCGIDPDWVRDTLRKAGLLS